MKRLTITLVQSFLFYMGITNRLFKRSEELPVSWDDLASNDIFLGKRFLSALESSSPTNISSYYVGVYNNGLLAGIAVIQRVEIYYDDIFRKAKDNFWSSFAKSVISKVVRGNALVVGNLMHTGQHGFIFNHEMMDYERFLKSINDAISTLEKLIANEFNRKIRIIAFKDFFENDSIHKQSIFFQKNKFYKVHVQPNMIMELDEWSTMEEYLSSFNKKYRRRYRTAIKKKNPIETNELDEEAIRDNGQRIFELYQNVSDNARVNSFKLQSHHFLKLKQALGNDLKFIGYFVDNRLVGFFTLILNKSNLEAYFLGYDPELQHKHQMYLNMLFEMVSYGLKNRFEKVVFARTAMEIKSSVGAKPKEMSIYLKHTSTLLANPILKFIVRYMNPIRKWEPRHPFSE